jgi:hypothetical protein
MRPSCVAAARSSGTMHSGHAAVGIVIRVICAAATQLVPHVPHRSSDMTLLCSLGRVISSGYGYVAALQLGSGEFIETLSNTKQCA